MEPFPATVNRKGSDPEKVIVFASSTYEGEPVLLYIRENGTIGWCIPDDFTADVNWLMGKR